MRLKNSVDISGPLVSVIMPVYNMESFVNTAVHSILSQTYTNIELIIIDDGSKDSSFSILSSIKDTRLRLLKNHNNLGLVKSLNKALKITKGEYIARMDADDISLPERLERQVQFFENHPEVLALGTFVDRIDYAGNSLGIARFPVSNERIQSHLKIGCPIANPTAMMRRNAMQTLHWYREPFQVAEDYDLWLRVSEIGQLANLPEVCLKYRIHPSSTTTRDPYAVSVSTLAAQRSARARRSSLVDPISHSGVLSNKVLDALGIDAIHRDYLRSQSYLNRAKIMLRIGATSLALEALHDYQNYAPTRNADLEADAAILRARIHLKHNNPWDSIFAILAETGRNHRIYSLVAGKILRSLTRKVGEYSRIWTER